MEKPGKLSYDCTWRHGCTDVLICYSVPVRDLDQGLPRRTAIVDGDDMDMVVGLRGLPQKLAGR